MNKNEKPLATWFKEKGLNVLKIRKERIFHLDFFCTEGYADQVIREHHKKLEKIK